jgi:anti-anti-sigma factor
VRERVAALKYAEHGVPAPFEIPPEPFAIKTRQHRRRYVVTLDGELDLLVAPVLASELRRIEHRSPEMLIVDLRRLTFMDLTGMRLLLSTNEHAHDRGYDLAVVPGPGCVRRLLEITGAEAALHLVGSVGEGTRPWVRSRDRNVPKARRP